MLRRLSSRLALYTALLLVAAATRGAAQGNTSAEGRRANVGLAAVGAFVVSGGWADVEHDFQAVSTSATVDLGHLRSSRVRLLADLEYLLTLPHEERVEEEGRTYRDVFRDLSAHVALAFHATATTARVSPYVATGVGVHILSSTFGTLSIDRRYNTNNFGLLAAAGVRAAVGGGGRRAVQLEVRGLQARDVRRVSVRVGFAALFNDLVRR